MCPVVSKISVCVWCVQCICPMTYVSHECRSMQAMMCTCRSKDTLGVSPQVLLSFMPSKIKKKKQNKTKQKREKNKSIYGWVLVTLQEKKKKPCRFDSFSFYILNPSSFLVVTVPGLQGLPCQQLLAPSRQLAEPRPLLLHVQFRDLCSSSQPHEANSASPNLSDTATLQGSLLALLTPAVPPFPLLYLNSHSLRSKEQGLRLIIRQLDSPLHGSKF